MTTDSSTNPALGRSRYTAKVTPLSAVLITKNEERNLTAALEAFSALNAHDTHVKLAKLLALDQGDPPAR